MAHPGAAANPGEQKEREGGICITRAGSVIATSVHQPSRRMLGLVDRLVILSRGRAAYCGDPRRLADFLAAFRYPIPAGEGPTKFALDAIRSSSPTRRRSPSSTPLLLRDAIAREAGVVMGALNARRNPDLLLTRESKGRGRETSISDRKKRKKKKRKRKKKKKMK